MGWAFFYMFVILKIPIVAAILLIWWAVREQPEATGEGDGGGGGRRDHPRIHPPRPPRRGPHGDPPPPAPPRVRIDARAGDPAHRDVTPA